MPTPRITDSITTAWPPLSAGKQRLYRIGTRLALDAEYRADASRFWNEEVPALLAAGKKKTTAADGIVFLRWFVRLFCCFLFFSIENKNVSIVVNRNESDGTCFKSSKLNEKIMETFDLI